MTDATQPTSHKHTRAGTLAVLTLALWAGLVAGLGEAAGFAWDRYVRKAASIDVTEVAMWMAPVTDTVLALILALILLAVRLAIPPARGWRTTLTVFGTFALLAPLLWIGSIAWWASAIIAAAIASPVARPLATRPGLRSRLLALTAIPAAIVPVGTLISQTTVEHAAERRAAAALPDPDPNALNAILIVLDTVRASSMSPYGSARDTTPFIATLASGGAVFEQAFQVTSWTLPSHVSLLSGVYRHETRAHWSGPAEQSLDMLPEILSRRGYRTGGFVANLAYTTKWTGLDQGFHRYRDVPVAPGTFLRASALVKRLIAPAVFKPVLGTRRPWSRKQGPVVIDEFLRWLDQQPASGRGTPPRRPFFVMLNFFDAHEPYEPPLDFRNRFGPTDAIATYHTHYHEAGSDATADTTSPEEHQAIVNAYDGAILYLDSLIQRLHDELRQRELLDSTLIVITSDHGEAFGEHYTYGHGNTLHTEALRVPLILAGPGITPGARINTPVSTRDTAATILEALNAGTAPHGNSLWPLCVTNAPTPASPSPVVSQLNHATHMHPWEHGHGGTARSIVTQDGLHYIVTGSGREMLYDLSTDPLEEHDLLAAASPQARARADLARQQLDLIAPRPTSKHNPPGGVP